MTDWNVYDAVVVTVIATVHPIHLINADLAPCDRPPSDQVIAFCIRHSQAKCIVTTAVCVCACLSLAVYPHYCTDPDVTQRNGRGLSRWLSGLMRFLSRSALLGLTGWRPPTTRVQSLGEAWVSLLVGLIVGML